MARRRVGLTAVTLFGSALISLMAAEVAVRVVYHDKFAARPPFYDQDAELGWIPGANLAATFHGRDFSMRIDTDGRGYRLGANGPVADSSPVVALVGDSYTFGWGASGHETLASHLDEQLAKLGEGPARVVNLGVGGYGTLAEAARLRRFMREFPSAADRVRAVVVVHSHNDMSDNVIYSLYRSGFRASSVSPKNRPSSSLHLVNLVEYLRWVRHQAGIESVRDGGIAAVAKEARPDASRELDDVLFAFPVVWTEKRRGEVDLGGGEHIAFSDLAEHEYSALATKEREVLGEVQVRLLRRSIGELNCAAAGRPIPILHVAIHNAPPWYIEPLQEMVANSETCGNDVRFGGRIPIPEEEFPIAFNTHSGSHFTPEVNARYGDEITALLLATGAVGPRRGEVE